MAKNITIEEELAALMADPTVDPSMEADKAENEAENVIDPADVTDPEQGEPNPEKSSPENETPATPETPKAPAIEAPQGLPAAVKAKWASLDPEMQAALKAREDDVHKMFTRNDGELNLGRKMKDVIQPYMQIIHAEGGTPETAVQSLLNTAYVLRTGSPQQKAGLVQQLIQAYGVDTSLMGHPQQAQGNDYAALQRKLAEVEARANPEAITRQLREQMETDKVNEEVKAFAADAANQHYEAVRLDMASMLQSGSAKTLREAYDKAIWANPDLRSTLLTAQTAEKEAKRKAELEAKKKAAVSVTGSAGKSAGSTGAKQAKSIEEELAEAWDTAG